MKVSLSEIWHFVDLVGTDKIEQIDLVLGNHNIEKVHPEVIQLIQKGNDYDTELLPDLFTNSEITWQPNEYASNKDCLTGLNILIHQCEAQSQAYKSMDSPIGKFYSDLIHQLENETRATLEKLGNEETKLSRILGRFRKNIYPIIKFLLEHPANHPQIKFEAVLRQDFMAKTLFNEYHVKFSELIEPHWQVWVGEKPPEKKKDKVEGEEEKPEPEKVEE